MFECGGGDREYANRSLRKAKGTKIARNTVGATLTLQEALPDSHDLSLCSMSPPGANAIN